MEGENEREEEISTLTSIYPELVESPTERYTFTLSLSVSPEKPVAITFQTQGQDDATPVTCTVQHLPPLLLTARLSDGYPDRLPPLVFLSTTPRWLPDGKRIQLEKEAADLWQEYGGCQILFTYIDNLQQAVDRVFDLGDKLILPSCLKNEIIAYDQARGKEIFEAGSYTCGVCLDPKMGSLCHRMHSCAHVFCRECLQNYYDSAITEGDITSVVCLDPTCGKDMNNDRTSRKRSLHPRELLEIGISESKARRFVELKRKKKIEADKTTVYCPRTWCQAPARSNRYPPIPDNLLLYEDSDDEHDHNEPLPVYTKDTPDKDLPKPGDRLTVCSKCTLAFCRVCYSGWHGEFARCWPRNPGELSAEEKASYDYIRLHTSRCPTCSSPVQKIMGCNHMICFQCNTHFCYLCSAWLDPNRPYDHFNHRSSACNMRLWDLEGGDEGPAGAPAAPRPAEDELRQERFAEIQNELRQARLAGQGGDAAGAVQPVDRAAGAREPPHGVVAAADRRPGGRENALRRFIELAARDEEDEWDSDELEDLDFDDLEIDDRHFP